MLRVLFILMFAALITDAQTKKRLYIGNDDHTDYMWSGDEAQYDSAFVKMLDYQLRKIDSTKNNPPDLQARFNCDGSYWLKTYSKYRSPAQFEKLVAAIRSGHISSPVTALVNCYGAQPTEAVIRGMYYAGQLERKYKLKFTLANAMENNTLPLGLSSLWAGSGAKYSWKGIGGYGSQLSYESRAVRKYQLYRSAGLDSSGVIMKWYNPGGKKYGPLGGYAECRLTLKKTDADKDMDKVISYLDDFAHSPVYPYDAAAAFGYGHDDLSSFIADPYILAAKKATDEKRTVRVSNEEDFFQDIEKNYPNLPSQSVSFGNEWDILCASMNEATAKVRRSLEKLRSAEALYSIIALNNPAFANQLKAERDLTWDGFGMYWEHNWTGDGPVSQAKRADWQIKLQKNISHYVDTLQSMAVAGLGSQIKKAAFPRFFVFNPLGWERSGVADVLYGGKFPVRVIDLTSNKEVLSQRISKDGEVFLRVKVEYLPSVGYKVLEVRPGRPLLAKAAAVIKNGWISNSFYSVQLSRSGTVTQIFDKKAKRQIVSKIDGRYLNDIGTNNIDAGKELVVENAGPVSVTYKAVSAVPVPHTTRITLYANSPKIEIRNSVDTNFTDVKTWAFSFNLNQVTTHHEELGAVLTVKKASRGGDYADQNARYDWQTFNHFADLSEKNYGVTISNLDCSFFKLGNGTVDSLDENSARLNALAGGRVDRKVEDKGMLGIANQNGETNFNYSFALTTHQTSFDPYDAMKFAMGQQNDLVTGWATGNAGTTNNQVFSLIQINNPKVLLWSLKPAEDGIKSGLIARFWNFDKHNTETEIKLAKPILQAWQTSHIETDIKTLKPINGILPVSFRRNQINTYRLLE